MKNNDLQQLKPIYIHDFNHASDDEISLVNLMAALLRRKLLIVTIVIITLSSGLAFALLTPRTYTSSVIIEVGTQLIDGSIQTFERPAALLAKLQYSYIPQVLSEHRQSNPDDKGKYKIKSSVPKGSNIILTESNGNEDQTDTLNNLLQVISQKAIQDHTHIFESIKKDLESRLEQANIKLELLKNRDGDDTEVSNVLGNIESLKTQVSNLRNTRIVLQPMKSLEPTGTSRKVIVIISLFAGIGIGVFAAFFADFWLKVQGRINEEGEV